MNKKLAEMSVRELLDVYTQAKRIPGMRWQDALPAAQAELERRCHPSSPGPAGHCEGYCCLGCDGGTLPTCAFTGRPPDGPKDSEPVPDVERAAVTSLVDWCRASGGSVSPQGYRLVETIVSRLLRPVEVPADVRAALAEYAACGEIVPDRVLYILAALAARQNGGKDR